MGLGIRDVVQVLDYADYVSTNDKKMASDLVKQAISDLIDVLIEAGETE